MSYEVINIIHFNWEYPGQLLLYVAWNGTHSIVTNKWSLDLPYLDLDICMSFSWIKVENLFVANRENNTNNIFLNLCRGCFFCTQLCGTWVSVLDR